MSNSVLAAAASVGAPFLGALLIAGVRATGRQRGPYAAIGLTTSVVTAILIGWLWVVAPRPVIWRVDWIGSAGIGFGFHVDELSLLFAVLVAGVGVLTFLYSVRYIPPLLERWGVAGGEAMYYGALLLFTGSVLGLVFAVDLIQLYVFWELIDVASFLLIGLNRRDPAARASAVKVLFITALGGLSVLLGFVLLGTAAGTYSLPVLLAQGSAGLDPSLAGLILVLLVFGAAAKAAQFPLHVWLPNAMQAPTPVNAFLDSAALLAAGVYLLARVQPIFVASPLWFWMVGGIGFASLFAGGVLALRATDTKIILAYSTVSQYGFMFALLGMGTASAMAAALFLFFQHGLLKAALFFSAGAVIHATGRKALPLPFLLTGLLALSLGGVPPLGGFWMKEIFVKKILEEQGLWLALLAVAGSALTLVYMLRFLRVVFSGGSTPPPSLRPVPRSMLVAPGVLALLTVLLGVWPELIGTTLAEPAAAAVLGGVAELDIGLEIGGALLLSLTGLGLGAAAFITLERWAGAVRWVTSARWSLGRAYSALAAGVDNVGRAALQLQNGRLPRYLSLTLFGGLGLLAFSALRSPATGLARLPSTGAGAPVDWRVALLLLLVSAGTLCTLLVRHHLQMILALGAVGYLMAGVFGLALAPNLGLLQVHVETLVTVLLVLTLARIPRSRLVRMAYKKRERRPLGRIGLAVAAGAASAWVSWLAIEHLPANPIAPWFNQNAASLTGSNDVVTAVLIDFRALDTLGEVIVFATAAIGVYVITRLIYKEAA